MQFSRILFPVDLSKQCVDFSASICVMAQRLQAHVILLGVIDLPPSWASETSADAHYADMDLNAIRTLHHQELEEFRGRWFKPIEAEIVQAEGDPATMICGYAETHAIDLIAMPTHGRGPFRLALLGSVTAKVLHDAKCPVWTSSHTDNLANDTLRCETILCSIDATDASVHLIEVAASLAVRLGARLALVHAIPRSGLLQEEHAAIPSASEEAQIRAKLVSLQQMASVKVPLCIVRGEVADGITRAARQYHANLVVIGRGHVQEYKSPFRSSVYWTICQSPCSVLCI
jgi:nucleotide-binding universal stress UspA family protein